jgi:hypothetical protein
MNMKVRCRGCGKVVKLKDANASEICPECGRFIAVPSLPSYSATAPAGQASTFSKGELPTWNKPWINLGCLILALLQIGIVVLFIMLAGYDKLFAWCLVIVAVIGLFPLGAWFERKTIRSKLHAATRRIQGQFPI